LAYKENVDDFRESPSVTVADKLIAAQIGDVIVAEPFMASSNTYNLVSLDDGLARADIVVHLTAHDAFKAIRPDQLKGKTVINTRGDKLGG
jgi:UDP-N-acetyl-D-mannosaminuronic acid dehydrogenase